MKGISDYTVVYDITANGERRRVEKVLKDFGFRIQKSVFECRMDRRAKDELIRILENLNLKTGFVKIYRLEYSWKNCVVGEQKKKNIDDEPAFIV
jgi:CRISPR-associated protein Cas2